MKAVENLSYFIYFLQQKNFIRNMDLKSWDVKRIMMLFWK